MSSADIYEDIIESLRYKLENLIIKNQYDLQAKEVQITSQNLDEIINLYNLFLMNKSSVY